MDLYKNNKYPNEDTCFCHTCGNKCLTHGFIGNPKINNEQSHCI